MAHDPQLPPAVRKLLSAAGLETDAPIQRRIFTNRNLALDTIPIIGFDMDYTLARYREDRIEELALRCTIEKLIARGYPTRLREIQSDPDFAIRGLVVDRRLGNVIKMDRHGYVGRAYHGRKALARDERKAVYRNQRLGQEKTRFTAVDTLFALPEVTVFADVVELSDSDPGAWGTRGAPSYAEAWNDVRECIDEAHRDGSIKDRVREDPGAYIEADADLAPTLHKFRSAGKKLFLLTNSLYDYTDVVLGHLLNRALPSYPDWQSYFDWIVVGAAKPAFFADGARFQEHDRDGRLLGGPKELPQRGKIYHGGNQQGLQTSLGVHADEVLYVGDHIYGDIVRSKKSSGWRTALIVSELEHDLAVRSARKMTLDEIEGLHTLRASIAEEISRLRYLSRVLTRLEPSELVGMGIARQDAVDLLDHTRADVRRRFDELRHYETETSETLERRSREVDQAFNGYWGSVFAERRDSSLFGAQVEFYACVYTSRVSNFQYVSPATFFLAPHGSLPHWY